MEKKQRIRKTWPSDGAAWTTEHDMRTIKTFDRTWARVPPKRRPGLRAYLVQMLGQLDVEEAVR